MRTARTMLIITAIVALLGTGCVWNFETLDGNGGAGGRTTNSVGNFNASVIYNGRPHVFYYDFTGKDLRHAYWNGVAWAFETLDGNGGPNGRTANEVGWETSVILYNGRPHVFYRDQEGGNLRHAYWNGIAWAFETLDGAGGPGGRVDGNVGFDSGVVLYNGRPHVFYGAFFDGNNHLRHAYWNGVAWAFETLDGNGGPNGRTTNGVGGYNTAILYNGRPHVFYRDFTDADLRHGYWNGVAWAFETLDGNGGPNGRTTEDVPEQTSALVYNGRPHVFYGDDSSDQVLHHAYYNGLTWIFEVLDGAGGANGRILGDVGAYSAAVLDNGRPHVFYWDASNDDLRSARYTGSTWLFDTLDGAGGGNGRTTDRVGRHNASVIYNGRPDVFYYDADGGDLRHAYFG